MTCINTYGERTSPCRLNCTCMTSFLYPLCMLCGADTRSMTVTASQRLDAFDQWCPRTIHSRNLRSERAIAKSPVPSQSDIFDCSATSVKPTYRVFTHGRSKPPSTVCQRIGSARVVAPASLGCRQSRETSRHRTPTSSAWPIAQRCSRWHSVEETSVLREEQAT